MYEAKLEFPEGWGVIGQTPSVGGGGGGGGGYGYFLEPHNLFFGQVPLGGREVFYSNCYHCLFVIFDSVTF